MQVNILMVGSSATTVVLYLNKVPQTVLAATCEHKCMVDQEKETEEL